MNTRRIRNFRTARVLCVLSLVAIASVAGAAPPAPGGTGRDGSLERLFWALGEAGDEDAARAIEEQIWRTWIHHEDPDVDALMQKVLERRRWHDFEGALALLDELVVLAPDYAEAFNQRATVKFQLGRYDDALWDIAETLKLEPRHFGALAGRGVIRLEQGKPALAFQNILAAMEIHPFLKERYLLPESLLPGAR